MKAQLPIVWSFDAIGTRWQISLYQSVQPQAFATIKQTVTDRIEQFDRVYSRFRADSLVTQIAEKAGSYEFPEDARGLFTLYRKLYETTDGAVTPLIGQMLSDAGYDATYSLKPKRLTQPPAWESVMQFRDCRLTTAAPLLLDFGAAGKGYLVDIIFELLINAGIDHFCVNAGGDMRCHGLDNFRVGLEHPSDPEQVIGVLSLSDQALCGSAGNRRKWQGYTHILDPYTLTSPQDITAAWCVASDTLTADGLTTALSFVEPEQLQQNFDFDYCVVYSDGTMRCSEIFEAAVFQLSEGAMA